MLYGQGGSPPPAVRKHAALPASTYRTHTRSYIRSETAIPVRTAAACTRGRGGSQSATRPGGCRGKRRAAVVRRQEVEQKAGRLED